MTTKNIYRQIIRNKLIFSLQYLYKGYFSNPVIKIMDPASISATHIDNNTTNNTTSHGIDPIWILIIEV